MSLQSAIPYESQWDPDANRRTSDCGQACVAMLAGVFGVNVAVNSLPYESKPNGITSVLDIIKNVQHVGLKGTYVKTRAPEYGDICLVRYGAFDPNKLQDRKFKGMHWVVFLRVEGEEVLLHDPNWSGARRDEGAYKHHERPQ